MINSYKNLLRYYINRFLKGKLNLFEKKKLKSTCDQLNIVSVQEFKKKMYSISVENINICLLYSFK